MGDLGLISGLGRSPGEGNDYPFQYSCLENSMYRGTWQMEVHGVSKSGTRLSELSLRERERGSKGNFKDLFLHLDPGYVYFTILCTV